MQNNLTYNGLLKGSGLYPLKVKFITLNYSGILTQGSIQGFLPVEGLYANLLEDYGEDSDLLKDLMYSCQTLTWLKYTHLLMVWVYCVLTLTY